MVFRPLLKSGVAVAVDYRAVLIGVRNATSFLPDGVNFEKLIAGVIGIHSLAIGLYGRSGTRGPDKQSRKVSIESLPALLGLGLLAQNRAGSITAALTLVIPEIGQQLHFLIQRHTLVLIIGLFDILASGAVDHH